MRPCLRNLGGNAITEVPILGTNGLGFTKLRIITLHFNKIVSLDAQTFSGMDSLQQMLVGQHYLRFLAPDHAVLVWVGCCHRGESLAHVLFGILMEVLADVIVAAKVLSK